MSDLYAAQPIRTADGRTLTETLRDSIHRYLPSATIVGDEVSPVCFEAIVARLFDTYADEILNDRTDGDLGLTRLNERLALKGEKLGLNAVRSFRTELIWEAGRRHYGRSFSRWADLQAFLKTCQK